MFSFENISEDEAIVLRTLLNLSEEGIRKKLNDDKLYWNDDLSEDNAVRIGLDLCESIMREIDEK